GLVLYDYGGSPCARRVRITLVGEGLEWDAEVIDLSRLEQRNPEYLAINPNGFVPTLAHGARVIYEFNARRRPHGRRRRSPSRRASRRGFSPPPAAHRPRASERSPRAEFPARHGGRPRRSSRLRTA